MNKDLIGIINSYFSKDLVMNKFPNVEKFDLIYINKDSRNKSLLISVPSKSQTIGIFFFMYHDYNNSYEDKEISICFSFSRSHI